MPEISFVNLLIAAAVAVLAPLLLVTGAGLICAGLLSVVIFPAAALSTLRERTHPSAEARPLLRSDARALGGDLSEECPQASDPVVSDT
jgi:hypothetical protein